MLGLDEKKVSRSLLCWAGFATQCHQACQWWWHKEFSYLHLNVG